MPSKRTKKAQADAKCLAQKNVRRRARRALRKLLDREITCRDWETFYDRLTVTNTYPAEVNYSFTGSRKTVWAWYQDGIQGLSLPRRISESLTAPGFVVVSHRLHKTLFAGLPVVSDFFASSGTGGRLHKAPGLVGYDYYFTAAFPTQGAAETALFYAWLAAGSPVRFRGSLT